MIDADELPDGWTVATIENLCTLNPKHPSTVGDATEVSFVPMAAVSDLDGRIVGTETRKYGEVKKGYTHFADGDVIFAKITPCMENGKAASVRGLVNGLACGTTEFFVFRSRGAIDQDFLFHFIRQESFRKAARATMQSGVGQARVPKEFVLNTELPLPPLDEQRRIVAKIEELMARSRAARAALAEVPTLLEQFRQSVLASAFRGDLTADWRAKNPDAEPASVLLERIRTERRKQWEAKYPKRTYVAPEPVDDADLTELPEGWCWAAAEEIVDPACSIVYGIVQPGPPLDEGVPYVRGLDIQDGIIRTEQLWKTSTEIAAQYSKSRLQAGDILLGIIRHTKVAIVPESLTGGNMGRATALLRPGSAITSSFLASYLESPIGQTWLLENQQGSDMPVLNLKELWRLPVPIAPLAEQVEVVSVLKQRFVPLQKIKEDVDDAVAHAELIDQSILAKAFRGELVPQDPADEPAAALLARIRSGGTTTPATPTRSVKRGRVKFYIVLLLRTWNKPLGREMLERGLVLMLNDDVRRAILGRSKTTARRTKKSNTPPQFVSGMDALLGEMLDDGWLVPGPEAGFFAEGQHGIDFTAAPPTDLDAVRETAEAMKVFHKDKQQATDADIVSALNGEIYELVS